MSTWSDVASAIASPGPVVAEATTVQVRGNSPQNVTVSPADDPYKGH